MLCDGEKGDVNIGAARPRGYIIPSARLSLELADGRKAGLEEFAPRT